MEGLDFVIIVAGYFNNMNITLPFNGANNLNDCIISL